MSFDLNLNINVDDRAVLAAIANLKEEIMATQAETVVEIQALTAQAQKIGIEIDNLLAVIAAGGNTSPELQDAIDSLKIVMKADDDKNPDAA